MKPICLHLLMYLLLLAPVAAQVNVDSLRQVAGDESAVDSSRWQAMAKLNDHYRHSIPDSALYFAKNHLDLASHSSDSLAIADALGRIGTYYSGKGDFSQALPYFNRGLAIRQRHQYPRGVASSLHNIGVIHSRMGNPTQALDCYNRSLEGFASADDQENVATVLISRGGLHHAQGSYDMALEDFMRSIQIFEDQVENQGEIRYLAMLLNNIGIVYKAKGDFEKAIEYYTQSLEIARRKNSQQDIAYALNTIGGTYSAQGKFAEALDHYRQGLEILEKLEDKWAIAHTLSNIGALYYRQAAYQRALDYFKRSLELSESLGDQMTTSEVLGQIGNIYYSEGEYRQALNNFERSLGIAESLGDQKNSVLALLNIGLVYTDQGEYEKAMTASRRALEISESAGARREICVALTNIGNLHLKQGQYAQAQTQAERALEIARDIQEVELIEKTSKLLHQTYKATGQPAQALAMHELYHQMRDSLNSEENQRATIRFEYQQQALADSLANAQEKALAQVTYENQLSQQRLQLGFAGGVGGLLAILAVVLYRNNRRRQQTNRLLSTQNQQIEAKSQQNELLLKEIHHRVKNNLQTISSLLYLQSAHIKDAEVKQAVAAGQHRVESMALIHQKLYQRDNLAGIEMKDYLSHLSESLLSTFGYQPERIGLQIDMDELELDVDTAVPLGLIVNELITNSLKYAFPEGRSGEIRISLKRLADGQLELLVADDGVGQSEVTGGTSFGSQLINLLTMQLGGKIEQGQEAGYWTRVVV